MSRLAGDDEPACRALVLENRQGSVTLCLPACDPVLQDCAGDLACHFIPNGVFACVPGYDEGTTAKPCTGFGMCAAGLVCVTGEVLPSCEGEDCCTSYCDFDSLESQCESFPGTVCSPFYGEEGLPPPPLAHIGVCIAP